LIHELLAEAPYAAQRPDITSSWICFMKHLNETTDISGERPFRNLHRYQTIHDRYDMFVEVGRKLKACEEHDNHPEAMAEVSDATECDGNPKALSNVTKLIREGGREKDGNGGCS
jgi:hypothetical protein